MHTLSWPGFSFEHDDGRGALRSPTGAALLAWSAGDLMLPVTGHGLAIVGPASRYQEGETLVVTLPVANLPEVGRLELRLTRRADHLELSASFVAQTDGALHAWEPLPRGARLDLYRVWNVRNRHHTPRVVERYNLGGHLTGGELGEGGRSGDVRVSTDSTDWQFAPHPSCLVLEKDDTFVFLGAKDIPQGFGLALEAGDHAVRRCFLDYGRGIFRFAAGETVRSPVFSLFVRSGGDYWDVIDQWVDSLVSEKWIPSPDARVFDDSLRAPLLAPWIDQCYLGRNKDAAARMTWNWGSPDEASASPILAVCRDSFIRAEVERAESLGLRFGSVCIDDRWFLHRGDYELDRAKFPDMRGLVDWLHAKGLKVLLWLPPFDVEPKSPMNTRREWLAGCGALTKHGQPFLDYSNPEVRERFLLPKLRLWLSDAPGCWNADGFKIDFIADKIPANIPVHDRDWLGEERFIERWHRYVREQMAVLKPGGILLGCSPHPHLAAHQDWVRTFDVHDSDIRQHGTRGLRIRHFTPGTLLSYDFHIRRDRFAEYLALANAERAHLEIGGLFGFYNEAMSDEDHRLIRDALAANRPLPGLRRSPADEARLRLWNLI